MLLQYTRRLLIAFVLAYSITAHASAQSVEVDRSGLARQNLISANPIGLLFQWYNGELEHAFAPTASVAAAGTSFELDNTRYTAVDGILRYYPSARALRGFSVGASAGFVSVRDNPCGEFCTRDKFTAGTIGVRGDYVWILGRDQRFSVETGVGAKRIFGNHTDTEGLPIGRLSIGYAW